MLRLPLYLQTLVAMLLGVAAGLLFGPSLGWMSQVAKFIIQWIQALATPLLFAAIFEAVLSGQFRGKGVRSMIVVCLVNAGCAITIALTISNTFHAGRLLDIASLTGVRALAVDKKWDWSEGLKAFMPESLFGPFVSNTVPAIIAIAILFGLALLSIEKATPPADRIWFHHLRAVAQMAVRLLMRVLEWIIRLVPVAVFASVAKVVGEHGFSALGGLGAYLVVTLSGMTLQILVVYQSWIALFAKQGLKQFWREAREPALYAFGVNSSLATLPVTLRSLERLKVSPASARLSACVGTNLNNDGILLYEVVAALFVAQAYGISLSLPQQLGLAVVCVVATIGVAGIPEAGIISLFLVLNTAALPAEAIPLLLSVDWIVARYRSVTNVLADMTVAVGIDALSPGEADPAVATA